MQDSHKGTHLSLQQIMNIPDIKTASLLELQTEAALRQLCYAGASDCHPGPNNVNRIMQALADRGMTVPQDVVLSRIDLLASAKNSHGLEVEIEWYGEGLYARIECLERAEALATKFGTLRGASSLEGAQFETPGTFLRAMYDAGSTVLTYYRADDPKPTLWTPQTEDKEVTSMRWYVPLPTTGKRSRTRPKGELKHLAPKTISHWNAAVANLGSQSLEALIPRILSNDIPVRTIVSPKKNHAEIVFSIDAHDKEQWLTKCRTLKDTLQNCGVHVKPFRYDWKARLPDVEHGVRLVYARPIR